MEQTMITIFLLAMSIFLILLAIILTIMSIPERIFRDTICVTGPMFLVGCVLVTWLWAAYKQCQQDVQLDIFPVQIIHNQPYIYDGTELIKIRQDRNVAEGEKVLRKKWNCDKYYYGLWFLSPTAEYTMEKK